MSDMEESDDYELQLALALSMQGEQVEPAAAPQQAQEQQPQQAAPAATGFAPPPGVPADLAAALAAAFQAVAGQGLLGGQQPQAPAGQDLPQLQPQAQVDGQQLQQPAVPAPPRAPPPPWVEQLGAWWQDGSGSDPQKALLGLKELVVPLDQVPAALAALSAMLQQPVVCPAAEGARDGAAAANRPAGALWLTCAVPSGAGCATIKPSDLDTLLATWLARASAATYRASAGGGQLALLAAAAARAPSTPPASEPAGQLVALLGLRLAARAAALLGEDDEDLFFETGRSTSELLEAMRSPAPPLGMGFLSAMVGTCSSAAAAACWGQVLAEAVKGFAAYKLTGGVSELEPYIVCLDRLTQEPRLLQQLAASLAREVGAMAPTPPAAALLGGPAALPLTGSLLGPLLALASAPDARAVLRALNQLAFFSSGSDGGGGSGGAARVSAAAAGMCPATALFTSLRGYPRNAGEVEGAKRVLSAILGRAADTTHQLAKRLAGLKAPGLPAQSGREVLLSWLAAVAAANEARCRGGEYGALRHLAGAPDGHMLTLTAAVLRLAKPFVTGYISQNPKFADLLTRHLSPRYYATHAFRLGSAAAEPTLSGERGVAAGAAGAAAAAAAGAASAFELSADPGAAAGAASFITEVFFLAQRYVRVGLMPSVHRYLKLSSMLRDTLRDEADDDSNPLAQQPTELSLYHDCAVSQLMQPDMAADAVQFAVLEIIWLAELLTSQPQPSAQGQGQGQAQGQAGEGPLALVPESVLSDAAAWLTFVIHAREAEQLAAVPIGQLMHCLVTLLDNPSQVRSLLVVSKLVHLLLAMLAPQVHLQSRTRGALGRTYMSPGETALVASVLGTSAAQQQLVPALMRAYSAADFVVGLDVDRDDFDKFTMRHEIDQLLLELWQDERCRRCIQAQAAAGASSAAASASGLFPGFVSALLNDLMYLFKDSLERLADIKTIEDSKRDTKAWAALTDAQRSDKEAFYGGQQRTTEGFMRYAKTTLSLLTTLTSDAAIASAFMVQPLLGRTAYAVLHFLELLVGPRCQALDVAQPERYHFDKPALLLSLVTLAGQLGRQPAFLQALGEEPDYDEALLATGTGLLNTAHAYAAADALAALADGVARTPGRAAKKQRRGAGAFGAAAAAAAGAAAAGAGSAAGGGEPGPSGAPGGGAVALQTPEALEHEIGALQERWARVLGDAGPKTYKEAEEPYAAALGPLRLGAFDADAPGAYNSRFNELAAQPEGNASQKLRRLGRELRDLRGKTELPVNAAAACFVRQDAERPDKIRCVISGPEDTPYEGGLFVFDVYFPPGYPNVPPLMVLETTGEGRARFNPNLYADGKVCLSLLGTWHGGDEASKWNAATSSLYQILLSVQGMIFVEDPYFNEPNVELMRGTSEGVTTSMRYNAELRVSTLRWAVLGLLRKPPPGLEDVVREHFRVLRGVLVSRAGRWLREAAAVDSSGTTFNRLADVMDSIVEATAALQQQSGDGGNDAAAPAPAAAPDKTG